MTGLGGDLQQRLREHEVWCEAVRDPASKSSEGERRLVSKNGKSSICYEIAPLPDSNFALRYSVVFNSMSGIAVPWIAFATRQDCINHLASECTNYFSGKQAKANCSSIQEKAHQEILDLLKGGLFGFVEPDVQKPDNG